jgi:hypothetical protein
MPYRTIKPSQGYAESSMKTKTHLVPKGYAPLKRIRATGDKTRILLEGYGQPSWHNALDLAYYVALPSISKPTKADRYVAYLKSAANNPDAGDEYIWGADGTYDHDHDGHPEADCSGLIHAARVAAGVKDVRTTADEYMHRGRPISRPSEIGDYAIHIVTGHGTHIVAYVGGGKTVEARGKDYGIDWGTVASVNARGLTWFRDQTVNIQLRQPA